MIHLICTATSVLMGLDLTRRDSATWQSCRIDSSAGDAEDAVLTVMQNLQRCRGTCLILRNTSRRRSASSNQRLARQGQPHSDFCGPHGCHLSGGGVSTCRSHLRGHAPLLVPQLPEASLSGLQIIQYNRISSSGYAPIPENAIHLSKPPRAIYHTFVPL